MERWACGASFAVDIDVPARPGQTARLRFVLDEPGAYEVMCSIPGHAEAGMVGMLVVEP